MSLTLDNFPDIAGSPTPEFIGYQGPFMSIADAGLKEDPNASSPLVDEIADNKFALIDQETTVADYEELAKRYRACLKELGTSVMSTTFLRVDARNGHEAGNVRRERVVNDRGVQTSDPKDVFQFNEQARVVWQEHLKFRPRILQDFFEIGFDIHAAQVRTLRGKLLEFEDVYPGMCAELFPQDPSNPSVSFLRVVNYDGYKNDPETLRIPVAEAHTDICWWTIQGYSTAPGLWARNSGGKVFIEHDDPRGILFASQTQRKVYGKDARIQPLVHGVDRAPVPGSNLTPERLAVVLFMNPWRIDPMVQAHETKALR